MPQRNVAVLIFALLFFTVSPRLIMASGDPVSTDKTKEEPLLSETLTIIQLQSSPARDLYRVTSIEKAAFLTARPIHMQCLKNSLQTRQPVEVSFTAYSLKVQDCHLHIKPQNE